LVHGFTQTGRSFEQIASALRARYEVVTVDLPGHGNSTASHAKDLTDAARLLGETGGKATYVGYSLGGRVCLHLGLERPDLIEALVLVSATPGIKDDAARAERREKDEALAERLDPKVGPKEGLSLPEFLNEWLAGPLFAGLDAHHAGLDARLRNTPAGLADALRTLGTGTQEPLHHRLSQLNMPVLLVAGEKDERFVAIALDMAALIGENARAQVIAGAGHAVPFEAPDAFLEVLEAFLSSRPTSL
jgi:2-succinyl-6-hydroxy-2,4-cyclohexadiene-1-carboxylate synthase